MLENKLVWICGASQGIGKALALELAANGARVAASARNAEALELLAGEALTLKGSIHPFPLDVTNLQSLYETLDEIVTTLGPVNIAVLNAGTHKVTPATDFRSSDIEPLLTLNVMGAVNGLEVLLPKMRALGHGRIAVVASLAGYRGLPTVAGYGASKAALINLCEALRLELHRTGVVLQVINPGFVKTPLTDKNPFEMPFLISAEKAAKIIAKGLQSDRFEIRFPGAFAFIMATLRLCPHWLYSILIRKKTKNDR